MAKFCGKCGLPLDENGSCPICDHMEAAENALETDARAPLLTGNPQSLVNKSAPVEQAAAKTAPPPSPPPSEKPKKKKKRVIIPLIIIILLLCALAGAAFAAFHFHWFGLGESKQEPSAAATADSAPAATADEAPPIKVNKPPVASSQSSLYWQTSFGKLAGVNLDLVREEPQPSSAVYPVDQSGLRVSVDFSDMATYGDKAYGFWDGYVDRLTVLTVTDRLTVKSETWITEEELDSSVLATPNAEHKHITQFFNWQADAEAVYAITDQIEQYPESSYRIVRFDKDTREISFISDENACVTEMTVDNGWIYYSDSGRAGAVDNSDKSIDFERRGLFKIKTDGSEKTRLTEAFNSIPNSYSDSLDSDVANISVYNDRVYFINLQAESTLCSINTDGTDFRQLSRDKADYYAIDPEKDMLYYRENALNTIPADKKFFHLCRVDLSDNSVEELDDLKLATSTHLRFNAMDGVLYLESSSSELGRYDVASGKLYTFSVRTTGDGDNSDMHLIGLSEWDMENTF